MKKPALLILLLAIPLVADATLVFEITRISDTEATAVATGTLDGPAPSSNRHLLSFEDPFTLAPTRLDNTSLVTGGDMMVGTVALTSSLELGTGYGVSGGNPWIYIGGGLQLDPGSLVTGTLSWTLTSGHTFSAIGSTGAVNWGLATAGTPVGSWTMVGGSPLPIPTTLLLLIPGMLLMALGKR